MLIWGLLSSVYFSYLIQGRDNTTQQLNRIMYLTIVQTIIWQFELLSSLLNNNELVYLDGLLKTKELTQEQEIFILGQVQIILNLYEKEEIRTEVYLIYMTNQIGQLCQQESYDFVITITAWEQLNLSQYQLVTMGYNNKTKSQSAGQKYFQLSAQTTGFLLMGISQLYSITGTINQDQLWSLITYQEKEKTLIQEVSQLLISVPQVFKLAAAPFHNWAPDLYNQIPTPIVLWIALIPKFGILVLQYNLTPLLFSDFLYFIAIISVIVGSIALNSQYQIKRFIAYSAISHIGFLQIAYLTLTPTAYFNYIIIYMLTSLLFFILIQATNSIHPTLTQSISIQKISGYFKLNPQIGITISICQFSLAGIPPLAGFFAKLLVQEAILSESNILIGQILIQASVISTINYLLIVRTALFDLPITPKKRALTPIYTYLISSLTTQILFFFFKPSVYLLLLFF